ncbi:MAG TPA: hypothetical protein VF533_03320 [Solirubrobacteraceae bacterium]|jgi:hypothetical protein
MPARRLHLEHRRDLGDLLRTTLWLFARHAPTFLAVTLLVVGPAWVALHRLGDTDLAWGVTPVWAVVVPPLVTALHVRIVQRLGEGVTPTPWAAVAEAAGRLPTALVAGALYAIGVTIGLALLVVPGWIVAVRWYFAPQAAVLDRGGPIAAVRAGHELTRGSWARILVYLVAAGVALGVLGGVPADLLAHAVGGGAGVGVDVLAQTVVASLTALFGTLLYFDLRVRQAGPGPRAAQPAGRGTAFARRGSAGAPRRA